MATNRIPNHGPRANPPGGALTTLAGPLAARGGDGVKTALAQTASADTMLPAPILGFPAQSQVTEIVVEATARSRSEGDTSFRVRASIWMRSRASSTAAWGAWQQTEQAGSNFDRVGTYNATPPETITVVGTYAVESGAERQFAIGAGTNGPIGFADDETCCLVIAQRLPA